MKKILVFLILFLCGINITYAEEVNLTARNLSYYVLITKNDGTEMLLNPKKIMDNKNIVVFSTDFNELDNSISYEKNSEINENNFGSNYELANLFATIEYYGYLYDTSNLSYFLTQVILWENLYDIDVKFVKNDGTITHDYDSEYNKIKERIRSKNIYAEFIDNSYDIDLWNSITLNYNDYSTVLDNPIMEELSFDNIGNSLIVTGNKIGNYDVTLTKTSIPKLYSFKGNNTYYWQNLGGSDTLKVNFNVNVKGVPLKIIENYHGVNDKFGDSLKYSHYDLYLEDEFKFGVVKDQEYEVKSNSSYILKDNCKDNGYNKVDDIYIDVLDSEYTIYVDKYVISKNISFIILDNNEYEIYLKSNNELYYKINKDTDLITLPYGNYYIKGIDYHRDLEVFDSIDEVIEINNGKEEIINKEDKVLDKEEINSEEISNYEKPNDNTELEEINENEINKDDKTNEINPKTYDNIYTYIIICVSSIVVSGLIILIKIKIKK